jgi:hypothetical protein
MGPGSNIGNYGGPDREHERVLRDRERDQDWDRERGQRPREWERERDGSEVVQRGGTPPPYANSRSRYAIDERDGYMSHARGEPRGYHHHNDAPHPAASRSLSPRSRSISPPRRSPRDVYYDREGPGMRPQAHGAGVEMDMPRRAPPAHSEGDLERDIDMADARDRVPEPVD